jgi:hypothetical protein
MSEQTHDPELAAVASALASLAPSAGQLDRDQLLFRAGQSSVPRRRWFWPALSATLGVLAVALGIAAARRPAPEMLERVVYVQAPAAGSLQEVPDVALSAPQSPKAIVPNNRGESPLSYYRLEQVALRWGVEGLPDPHTPTGVTGSGHATRAFDVLGHDVLSPSDIR